MKDYRGHIYLASVLLESNRHKQPKIPSYNLSEWLEHVMEAGFDGIEVWENHFLKSGEHERERLRLESEDLRIFSSYCSFENGCEEERERTVRMADELCIRRIKYNLGKDSARRGEYKNNLIRWNALIREDVDVELICECHRGTVVETPEAAADFFHDLPAKRFPIITHPFGNNRMELDKWFNLHGERIKHLHVQWRDNDNKIRSLHSNRDMVERVLRDLADFAYAGSFSLEFTEGMGEEGEKMEEMFAAALSDLQLLRELKP